MLYSSPVSGPALPTAILVEELLRSNSVLPTADSVDEPVRSNTTLPTAVSVDEPVRSNPTVRTADSVDEPVRSNPTVRTADSVDEPVRVSSNATLPSADSVDEPVRVSSNATLPSADSVDESVRVSSNATLPTADSVEETVLSNPALLDLIVRSLDTQDMNSKRLVSRGFNQVVSDIQKPWSVFRHKFGFGESQSHVISTSISPDGATVVGGITNGKVRLYDVVTGEPKNSVELCNTPDRVTTVQYNANGEIVAVGDEQGNVTFCHLVQRTVVRPRTKHTGRVNGVDFNANRATGGNVAISWSDDSTVIIWDASTGRQLRMIGEQRDHRAIWRRIKSASVHVNDENVTRVVYSTPGGAVNIVNIVSSAQVEESNLEPHNFLIADITNKKVKFHPNGKVVAIGRGDGLITLKNLAGDELYDLHDLSQESPLTTLCFSPDGLMLASGDARGVVRLWNIESERMVRKLADGYKSSTGGTVSSLSIDIVTDENDTPVLFCGFYGAFAVWKGPLDKQKSITDGRLL